MDNFTHVPVLLKQCIDGLNIKKGGTYFDGTLGGAGHSFEILKKSSPNGVLIATDLDDYAIEKAKTRLKEFESRYNILHSNFKDFKNIKEQLNIDGFDGILLDLGVSSFQLDDKTRGFSYMAEQEKLDMRMNKSSDLTAEYIVNNYEASALKKILEEYGEEKFAYRIAENIVNERKKHKITTVGQLNKIISDSIPYKFKQNGHPSKKTYQALRIEVNGELDDLFGTIKDMAKGLKKGGRLAVITFHSLEDRIVKQAFKDLETDCICDKSLPICVCGKKKEIEIITKHPIIATAKELEQNPRAKSAKLRIAEKI